MKLRSILAVLMLCVGAVAFAQTADKSGLAFSASSEATALSYGGEWSPATHVTESLDLIDFGKDSASHLAIEGHQVVASGAGFSSYLGGLRFTPNVSGLLSKTNIPADSLGVYFDGAIGNTLFNAKGSNFTSLVGGGVQYKLTNSLTWSSLHANLLRVGGKNAVELSTGLQFFFSK